MTLVTVIIPTYNYAHYIVEAIEKSFAQATENIAVEVVVVDDGSTDNTKHVLAELIAEGKIRYYFQENRGKSAATRKAIELASGKYIFNLDADDYFLPGKVGAFVSVFEKEEKIVHVGSAAKLIDGDGNYISTEKIDREWADKPVDGLALAAFFLKKNCLWAGGSTYAARADVLKKLDIPDSVDMYLDEYLILGILGQGLSYCFTEPKSIWRVHGTNFSARGEAQKLRHSHRLLKSSNGVLEALKNNGCLPENFLRIYEFRHQTRQMANREDSGEKSIGDILRYAREMFAMRGEGLVFFKDNTCFNRLAPMSVLRLARAIKGGGRQ